MHTWIEVSGEDLTDEQIETLQAGACRSPVWNLMRLSRDMEPSVSASQPAVVAN